MSNFDNYIYHSICEKSLDLSDKTNFMSYRTFSQHLKTKLEFNLLSSRELNLINTLSDNIAHIYGLSAHEAKTYVCNYFADEKFIIFEEPVKALKKYFKNSFS